VGLGLSHFLRLQWLRDWLHYCAFELRPLSLHVGWVWWLAGILFLIYFLISVLFPHPVECCVKQISARPATTFAFGVAAKLAVPLVCLILAFTVIGTLVVPFVIAAEFLALLVGKVAILEYLGGKITGLFGLKEGEKPVATLLAGAILINPVVLGARHRIVDLPDGWSLGFGSGRDNSFRSVAAREKSRSGGSASCSGAGRFFCSTGFPRGAAGRRPAARPGLPSRRFLGADGCRFPGYDADHLKRPLAGAGVHSCGGGLFFRDVGLEGDHHWRIVLNCKSCARTASP